MMKLKFLKLENFRNYDNLELELNSNITALVGRNAQGKTNLLEAIAFLALGKSFRAGNYRETLGWEREHGRIRGTVENNGKDTLLELFFQRSPEIKKVKKQGKVVAPKEMLGHFKIVLFTPESLLILDGSPKLRRQYFDRILIQLSRDYFDAFSNYQAILKQRNALLKKIKQNRAAQNELDVWDGKLIENATTIWFERVLFAKFLDQNLSEIYSSISGSDDKVAIKYNPPSDRFDELLLSNRHADIYTESTNEGPHRDDFKVFLNKREISEFASRGEFRTAVLAMQIAQIRYIEKISGHRPMLLLDDVFSELDEVRQQKLGEFLKEYQTFITTTSKDHLKGLKDASFYRVNRGSLEKI